MVAAPASRVAAGVTAVTVVVAVWWLSQSPGGAVVPALSVKVAVAGSLLSSAARPAAGRAASHFPEEAIGDPATASVYLGAGALEPARRQRLAALGLLSADATAARDGKQASAIPIPICVGIIAYQGVKTLEATLQSYHTSGLFDMVSETIILFQGLDTEPRLRWAQDTVSRHPLMTPLYLRDNIGHQAFGRLADRCTSECVVVVEEDFNVQVAPAVVKAQLLNAVALLRGGVADAVRMRSRKNAGAPNYSYETFRSTGKIGSTHLISHVMWNDHAEDTIPEIRVCVQEPKTWCTSSSNGHYTNNPVIYRTPFARRLYAQVPQDKRQRDLEAWLTVEYWPRQNYTVAYPDAIFTHQRIDRTFGSLPAPDDDAALQSWGDVQQDYRAIVLQKMGRALSMQGRAWAPREPSASGGEPLVDGTSTNDIAAVSVLFSSVQEQEAHCDEVMQAVTRMVAGTHPDEQVTMLDTPCGYRWSVGADRFPTLRGARPTAGSELLFTVVPLIQARPPPSLTDSAAATTSAMLTHGDGLVACPVTAVQWRKDNGVAESHKCLQPLQKATQWFEAQGIAYAVGWGSLLGWYRQCSCIANSDDLDIAISAEDAVTHHASLAGLGSFMYLDKGKTLPRILKVWPATFGMHLDVVINHYSPGLGVRWYVDGDETTAKLGMDSHNTVTAVLHGVNMRIPPPADALQWIRHSYCDRWNVADALWEHPDTDSRSRLEIFGACDILQVFDTKLPQLVAPEAAVKGDLLAWFTTNHGMCGYAGLDSDGFTACVNKNYRGSRGGLVRLLTFDELRKRAAEQ